MDRLSPDQGKPNRRIPSPLWLSNDRTERDCRSDTSEGDACFLTTEEEWELWMRGPWAEACTLQRLLPDGVLKIIASGEREDPPPAERSGARNRATVAALMAEDKPAGCMRGGTAGLCRVSLMFCHRPKRFEAPIKVVGCQLAIVRPHSQYRRLILQEHLRRV